MVSGGRRPGAPQYNPANISATGGDGQNPKNPELKYRGLGYRTTGETNQQAEAAPIKAQQPPRPRTRPVPRGAAPGAGAVGITAESQFPEESILEGSAMQNPSAAMMPAMTDNPDYQAVVQFLPAMEWWASQPDTPQTTKDYVRYLRTII
jgi:hypothetical protein